MSELTDGQINEVREVVEERLGELAWDDKPPTPAYDDLLNDLFTYHKPDEKQIPAYEAIRQQARVLADVIHHCCPPGADRTAAMRQLQDTVMTANRAVALRGRSYR